MTSGAWDYDNVHVHDKQASHRVLRLVLETFIVSERKLQSSLPQAKQTAHSKQAALYGHGTSFYKKNLQ